MPRLHAICHRRLWPQWFEIWVPIKIFFGQNLPLKKKMQLIEVLFRGTQLNNILEESCTLLGKHAICDNRVEYCNGDMTHDK